MAFTGRTAAIAIVASAALAGGAMYWLQVYAYYDTLPETTVLRATTQTGVEPLSLSEFEGIDATSSPLRFRACAQLADPGELSHAVPAEKPEPLTGPSWFSCFDAATIGADLQSGAAKALLSEREIHLGVDRILAVYPDGRVFAWHQLNGTLEN
ncbi:DUF6446 family protein [Falsigemmobacter faecalis]|nr:DUF6446 family protein [Falsigemmobacter faecalis]